MKVGQNESGVVAYDDLEGKWLHLATAERSSVLDVLAMSADQQAALLTQARNTEAVPPPNGLPFETKSLRAFALWESHMVNGARGMVRRFASPATKFIVGGYEAVTGKPFPALKPKANFYRYPQFYMSNHRAVLPDGAEVEWPSFAQMLDFELEVGVVIAKSVRNPSPQEAFDAIGGFVVMNDWSARDTQWDDTRKGTFGGVVKAKTFAGAMSSYVVTRDQLIASWRTLCGRVRVNGETWCEGSTANPMFDLADMVSYASWGEWLHPGDVLSTGTLPGCCGLEMGRFPQPGDKVQLEIDGIGTLTNTLGKRPQAQRTRA